ncbi:MAG: MFS transporter [Patescibacteria group bacterium]
MTIFKVPPIFKNGQFLRLWLNQVFMQVGFNLCNYTILLILADRTHSPFVQSLFFASLTLPAFVFGLIAGPIVDMVNRKRLMLISDILLAFLFLFYAFSGNKLITFAIIAFLTSSTARFFIPAQAATIPLIVGRETLSFANALFLFTLMGSVILGYSIASPIIEIFGGLESSGELAPFLLSSVFVVIGFILLLGFKDIKGLKPELPQGTIFKKTFLLLWQTVREVRSNQKVSLPILLLIFVELNLGILSVVFLEYVRRFLNLPLTSVGVVLMLPLIFGLIFGLTMLKKIQEKYSYRISISRAVLGIGVLFFLLGVLPVLGKGSIGIFFIRAFTSVAAFITGILVLIISVQSRNLLQTSSSLAMQGRIFSFLDIMIAIITPIPVLFIGFIADKISLPGTFVFIGLATIAAAIMGSRVFFGREIR